MPELLHCRGLFIIDPNGVIKHLSVNDLPVGRSVDEALRLVKAFQFVETHGEVCPAEWIPNSPTVSELRDQCHLLKTATGACLEGWDPLGCEVLHCAWC